MRTIIFPLAAATLSGLLAMLLLTSLLIKATENSIGHTKSAQHTNLFAVGTTHDDLLSAPHMSFSQETQHQALTT